MAARLRCPSCGESTFRRGQFVGSPYVIAECSMCGSKAAPTVACVLINIFLGSVVSGASVLGFFLLRPDDWTEFSRLQLLQLPEFWILMALAIGLIAIIQFYTIRLRRRED